MKQITLLICAIILLVGCQSQEELIFNEGPVTIIGQIKNPRSETISFTALELVGSDKHVTTLDSSGHFQINAEVLSAHDNFLSYGGNIVTIFCEPGDTIKVFADGSNYLESLSYEGDNAKFNESLKLFFIEFTKKLISEEYFLNKRDLAPDEFLEFNSLFFSKLKVMTDSIISIVKPDDRTKEWMSCYLRYRLAEDLLEYGNHHYEELPSDYYNFETDFIKPNKNDIYCSQYYDDFVNKYYLQYKLSDLEGIQEVYDQVGQQTYDGLLSFIRFINLNVSNDFARIIGITSACNAYIDFDYEIVEDILHEYSLMVKDITCKNFLLRRIDEKRNEKPIVTNLRGLQGLIHVGEVFEKIEEDCKGKVIYIDCWGTWCGACINDFPYSNKLYEELDKEKVEFVYICVNSEKSKWQSSVKKFNLAGKNYFLTKDQSADLSAALRIYGVPIYIIIDKKGNIIDSKAKGPYSHALKTELVELMQE